MALTGLQIFKLMPKTNCKECGHPTCLAFSMALASSKIALDACPHVSDEAKEALGAASLPPVLKVTLGAGEKARDMGEEVVLFRHDKKFYNPACLAITIADDLSDDEFDKKLAVINDLDFERVGEKVSIDAIALVQKSDSPDTFAAKAKKVADNGKFAPILISGCVDSLTKAVEASKAARPLIHGATEANWEALANLAKANDCPLVVTANDIDAVAALSEKVSAVTKNIVLEVCGDSIAQKLSGLTQIRRQAIRKKFRPFGYPSIVSVNAKSAISQVAEASTYVSKYASIVVLDIFEKAQLLPLCALRQNLFSDPQKPAQVVPGVFPVGAADENSPVYCTTNFSLTYYTVEGELSASKIPAWIVAAPTDGTSVLTAWAAGKFNGEKIAQFMEEININDKIKHRNIVIPGYVAVLKAPLEEKSGWKVKIGPNEASGLPAYAKANV